jgi:hypothetical protein
MYQQNKGCLPTNNADLEIYATLSASRHGYMRQASLVQHRDSHGKVDPAIGKICTTRVLHQQPSDLIQGKYTGARHAD